MRYAATLGPLTHDNKFGEPETRNSLNTPT